MGKSVVRRIGVNLDLFLTKSFDNYLRRVDPKLKKQPKFVEFTNDLADILQENRSDLSLIFKPSDTDRKSSSRLRL